MILSAVRELRKLSNSFSNFSSISHLISYIFFNGNTRNLTNYYFRVENSNPLPTTFNRKSELFVNTNLIELIFHRAFPTSVCSFETKTYLAHAFRRWMSKRAGTSNVPTTLEFFLNMARQE